MNFFDFIPGLSPLSLHIILKMQIQLLTARNSEETDKMKGFLINPPFLLFSITCLFKMYF